MEERVSTIKKVELKKGDMLSMIMFDRGLSGNDLKFLEDEFDFYKEDIDRFVSNYKNIGIVFKLTPIQEEFLKDWKMFVPKVIKRSLDKFNNIFVNGSYDKALLVTNKRLLRIDLNKLNEKIEEINYRIESYDEKVREEMREVAEMTKEEHKGILGRIMGALRR